MRSLLRRAEPGARRAFVAAALALLGSLPFESTHAHGSMSQPLSRVYRCYLQGPEDPPHPSCQAVVAASGTQALYDWMGINQAHAAGQHPQVVPNGKLCSGNHPTFSGLDLARSDWQTQPIAPDPDGRYRFRFYGTAPHATQDWIFYVTRPGWNPTVPLAWADLDEFCRLGNVPLGPGNIYTLDCPLPQRSGRHVIYNVWQRSDSPEAFYTCIDVEFSGGGGDLIFADGFQGNGDSTPPSVPQGLSSPAQTATTINLSWQAATDNPGGSGVAGYLVQRNGADVGFTAALNFQDTGLTPATTYSYRLRARDLSVATQPSSGNPNTRVTAYFTQWGIYARNYKVRNIVDSGTAARITHINYAFGNVRNNVCEVGVNQPSNPATGAGGDAWADYGRSFTAQESVDGVADTWNQSLRGNWNQLRKLKQQHPHIKVLVSLGGWTWSRGFSQAARPENRQAFVTSCINAYIHGNLPVVDGAGGPGAAAGVFDGIDIDWEYPAACGLTCGHPDDTANFTALLAEFRQQLNAINPNLELTAAVGAGIDKIRVTQPGQYHQHLNSILVMTYDFHGTWESRTNHHSGLYGSSADPSTGDVRLYNTHDALQAFITRGVPASKLSLGVGFYGRGWTGVASTNNGLYQNGTAAPGTYEAGIEDFRVLKLLGWPSYRDAEARAHWIYNGTTFWSYDDPTAIHEKMAYTRNQGLGGVFFWELSGDDSAGTLSQAIATGLSEVPEDDAICPHEH
jgi:chitinase